MTPQRKTALISVVAALVLIGLKLGAGLASGSLGLISESIHSTDSSRRSSRSSLSVLPGGRRIQATCTATARPSTWPAVAEARILVLASLFISYKAIEHLVGSAEREVDAAWYTFLVIGVVIAVDASRTLVSWRASRRMERRARGERLHSAATSPDRWPC